MSDQHEKPTNSYMAYMNSLMGNDIRLDTITATRCTQCGGWRADRQLPLRDSAWCHCDALRSQRA